MGRFNNIPSRSAVSERPTKFAKTPKHCKYELHCRPKKKPIPCCILHQLNRYFRSDIFWKRPHSRIVRARRIDRIFWQKQQTLTFVAGNGINVQFGYDFARVLQGVRVGQGAIGARSLTITLGVVHLRRIGRSRTSGRASARSDAHSRSARVFVLFIVTVLGHGGQQIALSGSSWCPSFQPKQQKGQNKTGGSMSWWRLIDNDTRNLRSGCSRFSCSAFSQSWTPNNSE